MPQHGASGRTLPAPARAALKRVLGWVYWSRRRLRGRAGVAAGDAGAGLELDPSALAPMDAEALPAGAPACVLAHNLHGVYCVPRALALRRPALPVLHAILASDVWEPDTLELLCSAEREGDVVHAGAFVGDFLPALARSRAPGALVWAFEPNHETCQCAQVTVELNGLDNVVLGHAGLAAAHGTALLAVSDRAGEPLGGGSRVVIDPARARWVSTEEVALTSIDEAVGPDRRVAAMHLTVQGHEREALSGAMRTIERSLPLIVLARLPEADWIAANLTPLGYRPAGTVDSSSILRCG